MTTDAAVEILKMLAPTGTLTVVLAILAYRSPQLVKELFSGFNALLITLDKISREKARPSALRPPDKPKAVSRSSLTKENSQSLAPLAPASESHELQSA